MIGTILAGAASDTGLVREQNEDALLVSAAVFAVADGMGGYAAGEVASSIVIAGLEGLGDRDQLTADDLRAELASANDHILADGRRHPERAGMGTTVTGIAFVLAAGSPHWAVFNIGDSQVYRFWRDELTQLTVDHSEVAELVAAGMLTPDEARVHPRRNVVTRALGMSPPPELDMWLLPPTPGERFLICSDGLPLELVHDEIADVLRSEETPQGAADELVRFAVNAGGGDNVTVVVVDYMPEMDGEVDGATQPRVRSVEGQ